MNRFVRILGPLMGGVLIIAAGLTAALLRLPSAVAVEPAVTAAGGSAQWGMIAAALAAGLASLGAGIAVAGVGSAAVGALAEKPELLGRVLIFVGLAEGIAIYGLIVAILILGRTG
jgi:V/A-type H+-transporting ATPase subunit K